jgi:hypothetical protein
METGKQIWVQTGINFNRMQGPIISYNEIPVGVYKISMSKQGFYLEYVISEFVFDYKIYGLQEDFINHVIKTYNEAQTGNLGILLNGTKGTGKTVAAKMIANRLHLPVIIVQNMGQEMNLQMMNYLSTEINFDCVFFFDEYEKTFDKDTTILSFMDGVYNSESRKVFLLTTNTLNIDRNLIGRPSRIMYLKKFGNLETEVASKFLDDTLDNREYKQEVLEFIELLSISTIDILKSIVKEINIHGIEEFRKSKSYFNVETNSYTYTCEYASANIYNDSNFDVTKITPKIFLSELDRYLTPNPLGFNVDEYELEGEDLKTYENWEKNRKSKYPIVFHGKKFVSSDNRFEKLTVGQRFNGEIIIGIDYYNHVIVCSDIYCMYFYKVQNAADGPSRTYGLMNYVF